MKKIIMEKIIHSSILKIAVLLILSLGIPRYIPLDGNDILTYNFALTTDIALFSLSLAITAIFFVTLFSNNAEFIVLMCRNKSIMSIEIYNGNVIKPLIDGYIAGLEKHDKI